MFPVPWAVGPIYPAPVFYPTGWVAEWQYTPCGLAYKAVPLGGWYP